MDSEQAQETIDSLRAGMETRGRIGMALGIVMTKFDLTDDTAFDYLRRLSQHNNVKMRDVAEGLIAEHVDACRSVPVAV